VESPPLFRQKSLVVRLTREPRRPVGADPEPHLTNMSRAAV